MNREEGGVSCRSASGFGSVRQCHQPGHLSQAGILLLWENYPEHHPLCAFSASLGMSDSTQQGVTRLNSCSAPAANLSTENSYRGFCFRDWTQTGVSTAVPSTNSCDKMRHYHLYFISTLQ